MDENTPSLAVYLRDPLAAIWRVLASRRLAAILLALLAGLFVLSLVFPQLSRDVRNDPVAYGRWLADLRGRYGSMADVVRQVGLTDIRGSFLFRLLLVVIALDLVVVVAEQLETWSRTRHGRAWWMGQTPRQVWTVATALPETELLPAFQTLAEEQQLDLSVEQDPLPMTLSRRVSRATVWRVVPHLALLLILTGLLVSERWGWREAGIPLGAGQAYDVEHGTGLVIVNEEITADFRADGTVRNWRTALRLQKGEQLVKTGIIAVARPILYGGLFVSKSGLGPAAELTAWDELGEPLQVQALPVLGAPDSKGELRFRHPGDEGYFALPARNLTLRVTYYEDLPQQGEKGPVFQVQAYRSGQMSPIWEGSLTEDTTWILDRVTLTMEKRYYAIINVDRIPGRPLVALGIVGLLLGTVALARRPLPAVAVSLVPYETGVQAQLYYLGAGREAGTESWFADLRDALTRRLGTPSDENVRPQS